jgi:hypothetical protein
MWPFSVLRRARYERRYQAARLLLLGKYTFLKLKPEQQAAVREREVAYLTASGVATARVINRMPNRFFIEHVFAMKSLGILPALEGERWPIPDDVDMPTVRWRHHVPVLPIGFGRHRLWRYWFKLFRDFRPFDPATLDAQGDLAQRGIDIPIIDPIVLDDVHHIAQDGHQVTWREWLGKYPL